jgi:heme oxygenase
MPPLQLSVDESATTTSLRLRLRDGTSELHRRVEARLDLLTPSLTPERYRRILAALYGYYEPLEQRLGLIATTQPFGLALRTRAPNLVDDLAWLGLSADRIARLPRCTELPRVDDVQDAAGCLYVVEGAALGGVVVTRALGPRLGSTPERGGRFFADAGSNVLQRWSSVVAWLDALPGRGDAVLAAARATFCTLDRWLAAQDSAQ